MKYLRWVGWSLAALAGLATLGALLLVFVLLLAYPNLPSIEALADYQPKVPLRVYTSDGVLIGEFGEERRAFVRIEDVPAVMKQAIVAAEDERFYTHSGVDYVGVIRAAYSNLVTGDKRQGASTITMQVARNFFLSSEKTWTRKIYEVLLAFKIEAGLTKDQILEIYLNQIYLGQRAYGFAAAAQTYFGKALNDVSIAEAAMLAGMPKAPSSYNPVVNFKRAKLRQLYVLRRMHELGFIDDAQLAQARDERLRVQRHVDGMPIDAQYVAEMVRQVLYERYPEDVYTRGFRVYTTLRAKDQEGAVKALRTSLLEYDQRHGYRGPEAYVELPAQAGEELLDEVLARYGDSGGLIAAVVLAADSKQVRAYHRGGETVTIDGAGLRFARAMLSDKAAPNKRIRRGAIVRIQKDAKDRWRLVQLPEAEAAFISLDPQTGAVRSLVGGFDFWRNKYNHVTQAWRQPGSAFKPFIYSAALEKGFTPATIINDAPVVVDASMTGGQAWEPKNYDGNYEGPMRMRTALAKSKNMVSIRILQTIGPQYAQDYIQRFGFTPSRHPPYLTMALGAGSVTAWQMAQAYGVFANGGYRVEPYFIEKIVDDRGNVLAEAEPRRAGDESLRTIDRRNAFVMNTMLQDVIREGTARRAASLGRQDLAGKTGTTNDYVDAWFAGYQPHLVGVAWVGFDQPKKLGTNETGSRTALPMWIDYMRGALADIPPADLVMPEHVMAVSIDPETGLRDPSGPLTEYFYEETLPPMKQVAPVEAPGSRTIEEVLDQLF